MFALQLRPLARVAPRLHRAISTLPENDHIYVHPHNSTYTLSLLPSPTPKLALGTSTTLPPTPKTFTENPEFVGVLDKILSQHAHKDPWVTSDALAFASSGGSSFNAPARGKKANYDGSTGIQGGAGGGGVGGYVHVYDQRAVPAYGRIPEPQDIFGSLLVDRQGKVVEGSWETNGAYRVLTGMGGLTRLSPWLVEKVREELGKLDTKGE